MVTVALCDAALATIVSDCLVENSPHLHLEIMLQRRFGARFKQWFFGTCGDTSDCLVEQHIFFHEDLVHQVTNNQIPLSIGPSMVTLVTVFHKFQHELRNI